MFGSCPDWYQLILAAEKLHCTPWELMDQPAFWKDKALVAITAENQAQENIKDRTK